MVNGMRLLIIVSKLVHNLIPMAMISGLILIQMGCQKSKETSVETKNAGSGQVAEWNGPTEPNPDLPRVRLWMGPLEIEVELAATMLQVATGMMFREKLEENHGMLFAFPQPRSVAYYMKNTSIPLTAAYISSEGKIVELHDLKPMDETSIPSKDPNIQFVLEMNQGWFSKNGIGIGTLVTTDKGALVTQIPTGQYFR